MKQNVSKRIFSTLLALVMLIGLIPASTLVVSAAHRCPDCEDLIDGSPYCEECYKCDACVDLCIECGKCTDCSGSEICDGCSSEESGDNMCWECALDKGTHCPDCEACYYVVGEWCEECGLCEDCIDIDTSCSSYYGQRLCFDCVIDRGETHCPGCDQCYNEIGHFCGECGLCDDCAEYDEECSITHGTDLCSECAVGYGNHCPDCEQCYFDVQSWCEECMLCADCAELDEGCSSEVGAVICEECAIDYGHHCPNCDQCYFKSGSWCEECGQCDDCSPACLYCCEEAGQIVCVECAIDNGMHCPDCSECYGECGGEFCIECGICGNCAEINPNEDLCFDCAMAAGLHCPGCESYIEDVPLCEGCGACLTACPTGCREGERTRCLSALTQKKGELTQEERNFILSGGLVWGCDACQLACPHNTAVITEGRDTPLSYFREQRLSCLGEAEITAMSDEAFASRAYAWRGRAVITRNCRLFEEKHSLESERRKP